MKEYKIGEVFMTDVCGKRKKIKCVESLHIVEECKACTFQGSCVDIPCQPNERRDMQYVYYIETDEPLTE